MADVLPLMVGVRLMKNAKGMKYVSIINVLMHAPESDAVEFVGMESALEEDAKITGLVLKMRFAEKENVFQKQILKKWVFVQLKTLKRPHVHQTVQLSVIVLQLIILGLQILKFVE